MESVSGKILRAKDCLVSFGSVSITEWMAPLGRASKYSILSRPAGRDIRRRPTVVIMARAQHVQRAPGRPVEEGKQQRVDRAVEELLRRPDVQNRMAQFFAKQRRRRGSRPVRR